MTSQMPSIIPTSIYDESSCIRLQSDNIPNLNEPLDKDFHSLYTWLNKNRLSLNVAKVQSMTIATKHKQAAPENQNEQPSL